MELYIYPNIDEEKKTRLREAGVQFSNWRQNAIVIEGDVALATAIEVLGAKIVSQRTKHQGLVELVVRYPATKRPTVSAKAKTSRNRGGQARQASRENYIKACHRRLSEMRKTAREAAVPLGAELKKAEVRYIEAVRKTNLFARTAEELTAQFKDEAAQIVALDKVRDLRFLTNGFVVFTDCLYAINPETDTRHEIGSFAILVRASGSDAGVYWINQTRRVNGAKKGMHAPNIFPDGTCCNDEIKQVMLEMIGRCEFASLVDVAIQFVETVDVENPLSKMIDRWPIAETTTPHAVRLGLFGRLKRGIRNLFRRGAPARTTTEA